jgi:hypothetical protein
MFKNSGYRRTIRIALLRSGSLRRPYVSRRGTSILLTRKRNRRFVFPCSHSGTQMLVAPNDDELGAGSPGSYILMYQRTGMP